MTTLKSGLPTGVFYDTAVIGTPRRKIYTNGISRPIMTDGKTTWDLGIDTPAAVPTFNANINGSLTVGTNNYKFQTVYRRDLDATIGNGSGASAAMSALADPNDGIRLNIPAETVQSGIDKVEVYRTLTGGSSYFYDGEKAYTGSAITYDSTAADSALGAELSTDNAVPPARPFVIAAFDQLTFWGSKTYSTGTVAVTNGSATVTGIGTTYVKGMEGKEFKKDGDSRFYTILTVVSTTQLTLDENYVGTTSSGSSYTISLPPLVAEWSNIDSSANIKFESYPSANYDTFQGAYDNEKATGLGRTANEILLFTDHASWVQNRISANVRAKQVLSPGIGCINYRTICNEAESGDCIWMDQGFDIRRSNGTPGGASNLTKHFIHNILNGTHTGIHRNLRHDTSKVDKAHAIFYPEKGWLMVFFVLGTTPTYPNACFVADMKINPFGSERLPSPWMLWTGFTAVSSGLMPDSDGILRPFFGDDLGFVWQMDSGENDGVPSGTTKGTITGITSTVLTDTAAAFYTTADGLKGVHLITLDSNGNIKNNVVIQSNTATTLTVTAWDSTPAVGDTYIVGGIPMERFTKNENDGIPKRIKIPHYLHLTYENAGATRNLRVRHYTDSSSTPEVAAGQDVDVGTGIDDRISVKGRGKQNQLKFENFYADEPITLNDWSRDVMLGGIR